MSATILRARNNRARPRSAATMTTGFAHVKGGVGAPRLAGRPGILLLASACVVAYVAADLLASAALGWGAAVVLRVVLFAALAYAAFRRRGALAEQANLARTDYLTGVANLRSFHEVAEVETRRARRYQRSLTALYIDVDDFKVVNDHMGHPAGDELLREVARTLVESVREFDMVARLGGDEFGVLLTETDSRQARAVVGKLEGRLRDLAAGRGWPVSFSIGAATCEGGGCTVEALLREADGLMYEAKRAGKNRSAFGEAGAHGETAAA